MLFSLKDFTDFQLHAQDGNFGEIKSFLIDTFDWVVRYMIVEVGSRRVMLSMRALGTPDRDGKIFPVNITREKIMNSPAINIDHPLSRDMERELYDYFEWPYYWTPGEVPNTMPGDLTAVPLIDMQIDREEKENISEMIPETGVGMEENHLQDSKDLFGATIHATNDDHNAGSLTDMVVQEEDWSVLYLVVDTGGFLPGKKVLVSPSWVEQITAAPTRIDVQLQEKTIQESPDFNTIQDITDEYRSRVQSHYGRS